MKITKLRRYICICFFLILVFTDVGTIHAKESLVSMDTQDEIALNISDYIEQYIGVSTVGAEVAVLKNGKKMYQEAYGYADYEKKEELKENQVMEWGSVTKLFTWVSIMQLMEDGKLNLETDAREYLSNEFVKEAGLDEVEPFTILELMNHTAGFEDVIVDLGFSSAGQINSLKEALIQSKVAQVYTPGTVMAYSNYGAALAGYIVETITGENFYEYVQTNILDVLEMNDTTMNPSQNDEVEAQKPYGYYYLDDGNFEKGTWTYVSLYPCGSVNGTMEDMVKFAQALLPAEGEKSPLFNQRSTLDQIFETTYAITEGEAGIAHGFFEYDKNQNVFLHYGNSICFSSVLALDIEKRSAVIIASNQSNEFDIVNGLLDTLLEEKERRQAESGQIEYADLSWSNTYVPARYVNSGYLRLLRESAFLSLIDVSEDAVVLSQLGVKIVFENEDGNYIYDNDEVILGITDNKVTHFKLGDVEYVPTVLGRSELFLILSILVVVLCILYFVLSSISKLIFIIKRYFYKEHCGIIDWNKWLISVTGFVILINNVCLILNSLPWPVSGEITVFITMNCVLGVIMLGELLYYTGWQLIRKKQYSFKNVLPVLIGLLFLGDMLYWNLFFYS